MNSIDFITTYTLYLSSYFLLDYNYFMLLNQIKLKSKENK